MINRKIPINEDINSDIWQIQKKYLYCVPHLVRNIKL